MNISDRDDDDRSPTTDANRIAVARERISSLVWRIELEQSASSGGFFDAPPPPLSQEDMRQQLLRLAAILDA